MINLKLMLISMSEECLRSNKIDIFNKELIPLGNTPH